MEQLVELFTKSLGSNSQFFIGLSALIALFIPLFTKLFEFWSDIRTGGRLIAAEKSRLELLKLRYEIEALRKQHDLPSFSDEPLEDKSTLTQLRQITKQPNQRKQERQAWGWLIAIHRHSPALATGISVLGTILAGFWSVGMVFATIGALIPAANGKVSIEWWFTVLLACLAGLGLRFTVVSSQQGARLATLDRKKVE